MLAIAQQATSNEQAAIVLSKVVARAAERLAVSKSILAIVLGVIVPTITRLFGGTYLLAQSVKSGISLYFMCTFSVRWTPLWGINTPLAKGPAATTWALTPSPSN